MRKSIVEFVRHGFIQKAGVFLLITCIGLLSLLWSQESYAAINYVPDDYQTIQAAVDAAIPDDTIVVRDGTYIESVHVNKDYLTIKSENGAEKTTIRAGASDNYVFSVTGDYVNISGFRVEGWGPGIDGICIGSDYCHITHNIVTNSHFGIYLSSSYNNNITSNNTSYNTDGIHIRDFYHQLSGNTITDNTCSNNNNDGIELEKSYGNDIKNNTCSSNGICGIILRDSSSNNTITGNSFSNNSTGIGLIASGANTITGNTCSNNDEGIGISYSGSNDIKNNSIESSQYYGVSIRGSRNQVLTSNHFENCGILIDAGLENDMHCYNTHTIQGNTINGKPIYYYKDAVGIKVPEDAGEVIMANCTNMIVKDIDASGGSVGIEVAYTNSSTISNCNILNNSMNGIYVEYSSGNTVRNNILSDNDSSEIFLRSSNDNIISGNTTLNSNNGLDIGLVHSSNNQIYFNNNHSGGSWYQQSNIWNSPEEITYTYNGKTYKSYLGNYWVNYSGSDSDGDGIGDTPLNIHPNDEDNYPLMAPFENYQTQDDTDSDGLPDSWESQYFGNLDQGPDSDYDSDGLTNLEEYNYVTDPTKKDTDGDGYTDKVEIDAGTKPNDPNDFPVSDTTPPIISSVTTTNITQTTATVTWTTDEPATSTVRWGTDTNYQDGISSSGDLVTSHSMNLTGLTAGTLYHYQVESTDASGNKQTSGDFTFTPVSSIDITSKYYTSENPYYTSGYGGQCTCFAWGRAYEKTGIKLKFKEALYPSAKYYYLRGPIDSLNLCTGTTVKANSIAVWEGANGNKYGHVAYVERVENGRVYFNEANVETYNGTDWGGGYDGYEKNRAINDFEHRGGEIGNILGYVYLNPNECTTFPAPPSSTVYGTSNAAGHAAEPVNTALGSYTYQHTDLRIPGRGASLRFTRAYNSQDPYNGPLGYGWTHNYNIILTEDSGDGSVNIKWGDGHEDFYISNGDSTYTPQYGGVYDVLVKNADDKFTLTRKDQSQYDFGATGNLTGITYKNSNSIVLTYDGSDNLITITDTVGRDIDLAYDANNRLIQVTDPIARTIGYEYDANGALIKVTDAKDAITAFEYDDEHRLTKIILPKENILVDNTYDDQGRVISQTNGRGFISTFDYDTPDDGGTTITDPLGSTTIHTHDSAYRLIQMTDANGDTIHYAYDANNNRTGITDKNGNVTYYTYDAMGNVTSKTDALGNVTTITYDNNNNPTQRTDALGNITTYSYDTNGNLITTTDPLGNVSSITYNIYGQPLTLTDANGHATTNEYDAQGNLIKITDALGNITTFTFDGVGRRTNATNANGHTTSFTYDNNDNILTVTDPLGGTTAYTYDTNENRTSVIDPNGNTTLYSYDENDLLTTITDPSGNVTTHTYDNVDNKASTQDAGGNATKYSYDGIGNLIQIKDALNNTTAYTYDGNGNLLSRTNALGNTTDFAYDALNRLIQTTDPLTNTTQNSYDALGRMIQISDAGGRVTHYSYDALGRLIQVTDALGGVTTYSYDNIGNRTSITDAQGNTNSFAYDELNRLITKTDPLNNSQSYIYDGAGNRTSLTDANGNTIQYSYDGNSRLTDITYPDATAVAFSYDANGNRIGMTDQYGTYTYQFDELDRMTSYTDAYGKTVNYSYDEAGNRTSLTYPDNKVVNYTYDPLNRMSTVTDWLGGVTIYTYDAAGNLTNINNPNGTVSNNTYDNRNRLISIDNTKSDTSLISSYKFTLDSVGNRTQIIRNESLLPVFANANKSYNYDIDNRLLTSNGTAYNYDANGNMTSKGSNTYTYDYEDQLSRTSIGGVNTRYKYDGLGNRIARIEDSITTRYVLDISGSLSQVLAETDDSGTIASYYVYGLGLISKVTPNNEASYYHYDSRGSTVALTDFSETITDKYAYDPFGKLANSEGFTANSFKYVGRFGVMDEGNGLKYIRARYYAPELGRFITKDPLTGNDSDSQSLNRYVYALNNPVMLIDVSGLSAKEGSISQTDFGTSDSRNSGLVDQDDWIKDVNRMIEENRLIRNLEDDLVEIQYKKLTNIAKGVLDASMTSIGLILGGPVGASSGILDQLSHLSDITGSPDWLTNSLEISSSVVGIGTSIYGGYKIISDISKLGGVVRTGQLTLGTALYNNPLTKIKLVNSAIGTAKNLKKLPGQINKAIDKSKDWIGKKFQWGW